MRLSSDSRGGCGRPFVAPKRSWKPLLLFGSKPTSKGLGDELRAVVAANVGRAAVDGKEQREHAFDIGGIQCSCHLDAKPLVGELVAHRQALEPTPVRGGIADETVAPDDD